jgi:hypothetical protein
VGRAAKAKMKEDVLGKVNRLLSFDTTRTAQKMTRSTSLLLFHLNLMQLDRVY